MWMNLEKWVQRRPTSGHRCIPIITLRRALQTRILLMANFEKCWLHHCISKVEKTVNSLECLPIAPEKLAAMFFVHQFLEDMSRTQKINRFSEASQKLLKDMDQTEIFELCENSAKLPCPDRNAFTENGIICCSCGRNLKYKRSVLQHFKRTTTILIRSQATSLRRIPVEDQSMVYLRDKLCSSRRKTC